MQDLSDAERNTPASGDQPISKRSKPPILEGKFVAGIRVSFRPKHQPVRVRGAGVDLRYVEVDNPFFQRGYEGASGNPKTVTVARNSNESPLVRLYDMGSIDDRQARAGHMFRSLFERLMAGQASPSLIKERVDCSSAPDVFTEGRSAASQQLRAASEELSPVQYAVLRFVCGEGRSLRELDRTRGLRKGTGKEMLLDALDRLAEVWDLGKSKPKGDAAN